MLVQYGEPAPTLKVAPACAPLSTTIPNDCDPGETKSGLRLFAYVYCELSGMPNSKITLVFPDPGGGGEAKLGGVEVATGVGTGVAVGFSVGGGGAGVGAVVGGVIVGGVIVGGVIVGGVLVGGEFVGGVGPGPEPPPPPQATSVAAVAKIKANETWRPPPMTKFMSSLSERALARMKLW